MEAKTIGIGKNPCTSFGLRATRALEVGESSTVSRRMNGLVLCLLALALSLCSVSAYVAGARLTSLKAPSSTLLSAKKPVVSAADLEKYWQGDWVCADCGYIYDKDFDGGGLWFEEQKRGFICPQCSAPRKRYAKKVGDQWGVTRDGGDLPIYAWTFVGLAITTYFTLVVVPTL